MAVRSLSMAVRATYHGSTFLQVALLGDAIHAMMPNLGQGGCQAIEDASVIADKLEHISRRSEVEGVLREYRDTRLTRSAAVQGLSRFASDIIIRGFDTPCKLGFYDGALLPKAPPSPRARTSLGPHPHPHLGQPQP